MIIPIRCFTCNKVIGHLWEEYINKIQVEYIEKNIQNNNKNRFVNIEDLEKKTFEGKILDDMKLNKYCCRRMLLSHVDMCEKI
jgi:DNA-directed RNA polymerase I, II, and III subunit RPABC5